MFKKLFGIKDKKENKQLDEIKDESLQQEGWEDQEFRSSEVVDNDKIEELDDPFNQLNATTYYDQEKKRN